MKSPIIGHDIDIPWDALKSVPLKAVLEAYNTIRASILERGGEEPIEYTVHILEQKLRVRGMWRDEEQCEQIRKEMEQVFLFHYEAGEVHLN